MNLVVRTRGTAEQRSFVSPITDKTVGLLKEKTNREKTKVARMGIERDKIR